MSDYNDSSSNSSAKPLTDIFGVVLKSERCDVDYREEPKNKPFLLISGEMNLFKEGWNGKGVYAISGLAPSSFKTAIYVGSTENIQRRIVKQHLPNLELNVHVNKPLQNYYNKNSCANIVVWCLETCPEGELLKAEQKYIDYYGTVENCAAFNILKSTSFPMRGFKFSEESKKKMSKTSKGRPKSERHRKKLQEALSKSYEKRMKGIRKTMSKPFRIMSPEGKIIEGMNINQFSRENNLNGSCMSNLINGRKKSHKGYRRAPIEIEKINEGNS